MEAQTQSLSAALSSVTQHLVAAPVVARPTGSDALAVITPAIEERLKETRANEELSKSTDGSF
jgi:hypothetical protein